MMEPPANVAAAINLAHAAEDAAYERAAVACEREADSLDITADINAGDAEYRSEARAIRRQAAVIRAMKNEGTMMATKPAQTQVCPETNSSPMQERFKLLAEECTPLPDDYAFYLNNLTEGNIITVGDIRTIAALHILPSGQEVLCACSDACAKDSEIERLRTAMQEACDLLAERKRGHSARSPGHNARLCLQFALKPLPSPPSIEKSGG